MELPVGFKERMEGFLGTEEAGELFAQYEQEGRHLALRANTLKITPQELREVLPFPLTPVEWCPEGFYYEEPARPGLHPFHEGGLYYIQEPSAMGVGVLAGARPGERVLDLCAAPGGKATYLAAAMENQGILVANEIHPARAKVLSQNMERMGVTNALVCSMAPQDLRRHLPGFFHRVVVDAPCSGEGMFRKSPAALEQWSMDNIRLCHSRQMEILEQADALLAPGGVLVYSTCTFAPEENEGTVAAFLESHDYTLEDACFFPGFDRGRPDFLGGGEELRKTARLWPHKIRGEGHFMAKLRKAGEGAAALLPEEPGVKAPREWLEFCQSALPDFPEKEGRLCLFGSELYQMPEGTPRLNGLRVLRPGLHLGTLRKGRLEPAHALALALSRGENGVALSLEDSRAEAFLRGEAIPWQGENGWQPVRLMGFPLGWSKVSGGQAKNHYPKALRR